MSDDRHGFDLSWRTWTFGIEWYATYRSIHCGPLRLWWMREGET